jgi:hypothetical protein
MSGASWTDSVHSDRRCGITLVEVICGLGLAGTLLVSLILAHAAHARQIRQAHSKLDAVRALEDLRQRWTISEVTFEPGEWRTVPGHPAFLYGITERPPQAGAVALGCRIHRLEIFAADAPRSARPLASVDLLLVDSHAP